MPLYFFDPDSEPCKAAQRHVLNARVSVAAMKSTSNSDARFLVREKLDQIRARALVLVGRRDFICSTVQAQEIRDRIADAQIYIFENSGHFPWTEESDSFFSTVTRFLEC